MRKNQSLGIFAWILGLLLCNVLLFVLNRGLTAAFWITAAFVWIAYLSALVFQLLVWRRSDTPDEQFLHILALTVSFAYMLVQFPICIIFPLISAVVSWKLALLVHAVLLVLAWLAAVGSLAGNAQVRKVNGRQKNNHREL